MTSLYDFEVTTIDGQLQRLDVYRGQVLLIVNVASRCGFTPQYADLEKLYRAHQSQGFAVLGFPCNQFAHQEPLNETEIKSFCSLNYDVSFPLFAKLNVNGKSTHPLYRYMKSAQPGILGTKSIKWNFTKFLVDRQGIVVRRYAPNAAVEQVEKDLSPLLAQEAARAGD